MWLQHHTAFFLCQIKPVHRNEGVTYVQLLHIDLGLWMGLVSPFLQTTLEWQLSHDCYHEVGFGLVEILMCKHMCIRMEHSLYLYLCNGISIPFVFHDRSVGVWLVPSSCGSMWPFCGRCWNLYGSLYLRRNLQWCFRDQLYLDLVEFWYRQYQRLVGGGGGVPFHIHYWDLYISFWLHICNL